MFTQVFLIQGLKQCISLALMLAILFIPFQSSVVADVATNSDCMMLGCEHDSVDVTNSNINSAASASEHSSDCQDEYRCETSCSECAQFNLTIIHSIHSISSVFTTSQASYTIPSATTYIAKLDTPPPIFS